MRLLSVTCVIYSFFLVSCKKDKVSASSCRIKSIIQKYHFRATEPIETNTLSISYNSKGNPTTMDFEKNETGKPDYFFYYDQKGRLKELVTKYGIYTEYIHRYYYSQNQNLIAYDTMYYNISDGIPYSQWVLNVYEYDGLGRIIQVNVKTHFGQSFTLKYAYNNAGNLILQQNYTIDGNSYDSGINLILTNRVFAFLSRNYSANNTKKAISYNEYNLPLQFKVFPFEDHAANINVNFMNLQVNEIIYDCTHNN